MDSLSRDQITFLKKHNISLGVVFNAKGLRRNDYRSQMKSLDMRFAYGVTPCGKMGHTLRSRAGHCIQCDTSQIAFMNRHSEEGYVYVSISLKEKFLKIGCTNNIQNRESSMNSNSYAGTDDWETIFSVKTKNAGKIEFDTHKQLSQFYFPVDYYRNGVVVTCREIFKCEKKFAIEKIKKLIRDNTK